MSNNSTAVFFATMGVLCLAARYYFRTAAERRRNAPPPPPIDRPRTGAVPLGPREITPDMISVVKVIVPTFSEAEIHADLLETHSVEKTTERLLARTRKNTLLDRYGVDPNKPQEKEEFTDPNWVDVRENREKKLRQQREEMLLKARKRALELNRS